MEKGKNKINKYFNADEFLQKIQEHHYLLTSFNNSKDYGMFDCGIKQIVDEMSSADVVEVKHGEWIVLVDGMDFYAYECSVCHNICVARELKYNFCPWCGADMRGESDE